MCTADQLQPLIISWIEKRECCADQLRKLARELESLTEKCKAGECVGSSVAVVGAACVIGAGLATLFTAGTAAPFLGILGAAYTGTGVAVSVGAKIINSFLSSNTMNEAKEVEKRSNEIADKIQQLFDKLRAEAEEQNPSADPDELDQYITTKILTSMARRRGVKGQVSIAVFNDGPQIFLNGGPTQSQINRLPTNILAASAMIGILGYFKYQARGKKYELLFVEGGKQLVKQMSATAAKTVLKAGAKVVGGAVLLVFALDEAIDNWTDMVKKNHVTEASQSLRDTANSIEKATQTLRKQLDSIKKMLDEMVKCQQEQEEKEEKRKAKVWLVATVQSKRSAYYSHGNEAKYQCRETAKNDQQGGRKPGGQEQGGDNGGDPGGDPQGGDAGGQRSDSDEDESDTEEDDSDIDKENRSSSNGSDFTCQPIIYEVEDRVECSDFSSDSTSLPHISKHQDSEKIHQKTVSELSARWCEIGAFNTRSINKKQSRLSKFMKKFKLNILMMTETWVKPENGDQRIGEILPEEFQFDQRPREGGSKRGGGVAILFSNYLQQVPSEKRSFESFEHLARDLRCSEWARPMRTITVYRPPRKTDEEITKFLKEFQNLLDRFSKDDAILITGDFNIRVNDSNDKHAKWFKKFLDANGLCLHVKEATHEKHNTLDLVITRNVDICNLRVKKPITKINEKTKKETKISDHYAIIFSARPTADKKSKDGKNKRQKKRE